MPTARDIDFYACILNSLVTRRPFFLGTSGRGTERLVKHVLSFVPSHRYFLVTGNVPRWARYLSSQPRELQSSDLKELTTALQTTLEEERMGRRAVQLIFFEADASAYETVLKTLGSAWIATTDDKDWLQEFIRTTPECYELDTSEGLRAVHVGTRPADLRLETMLLERAGDRHAAFATFLVQMKFTQLHLAAAAVLGEWEERGHSMTLVDLEHDFELDAVSTEKMLLLAQAELGLDLGRCLKMPDPLVIRTADKLAHIENVTAVAALEDDEVVWAKRFAALDLDIACIAAQVGRFVSTPVEELGFGKPAYVWLSSPSGGHVAAMKEGQFTYVMFLAPEAKPALTLSAFTEELRG